MKINPLYALKKKNQATFLSNTFNGFTLSSGKISYSFCFASLEVAIESAETDVRSSLVSLLINRVSLHRDNYLFTSLMSASSMSP